MERLIVPRNHNVQKAKTIQSQGREKRKDGTVTVIVCCFFLEVIL